MVKAPQRARCGKWRRVKENEASYSDEGERGGARVRPQREGDAFER